MQSNLKLALRRNSSLEKMWREGRNYIGFVGVLETFQDSEEAAATCLAWLGLFEILGNRHGERITVKIHMMRPIH